MWGIELSFHSRKKMLDLDKNSALGDFSKSNTHSKTTQVVISAVVQT
jgi:hypothetical protein